MVGPSERDRHWLPGRRWERRDAVEVVADEPKLRGWSILFALIALYEIAGCTLVALGLEDHVRTFYGASAEIAGPIAKLYATLLWLALVSIGIGIAVVAWDPRRNRGILWVSILVRLSFIASWGWYWASGLTTGVPLVVGLGDVFFIALFLWFLIRTREYGLV